MSQINPLISSIAATPLAQRLAAAERDAEIHRSHRILKTGAPDEEPGDLFIESADAVDPVDNDTRRERGTPERESPEEADEPEAKPHIDVQA